MGKISALSHLLSILLILTGAIAIVGLFLVKRKMRINVLQVVLVTDLPTVEELKDIIRAAITIDATTITTLSGALACKDR